VITHPFSTISEKIQSILPTSTTEHTEETVLDSTDTFEEAETSKEQQVSGAEVSLIWKTCLKMPVKYLEYCHYRTKNRFNDRS